MYLDTLSGDNNSLQIASKKNNKSAAKEKKEFEFENG